MDGAPLTGQSDHILNFQIGLEDTDRLSQQTLMLTYASDRVTSRGPNLQPDIKERPGLTLDFVARQGVKLGSVNAEEIGRAHVRTPVTNAQLVCRLLLEKQKKIQQQQRRTRKVEERKNT